MFLTEVLKSVRQGTGISCVPFDSTTVASLPCIQYQIYQDGSDGVIDTWRLTIRVVADTLEEALNVHGKAAGAIVSFADEERNGTLNAALNGGGTVEDPQTGKPQIISYYDIKTRSN